jgi:outer membrane immunogenic protein
MKKFLLGSLGLVAMAAPALAADLPARTYTKAPPPVPVMAPIYDWTGFYIGANGGWADSHNCWNEFFAGGTLFNDGCVSKSGGVLGGQVGYRWQIGQAVFGLEAQGDWANIRSSHISLFDPTGGTSTFTKVDGLGLFTGQIGYSWGPSLLYVKGGAAVVSDQVGLTDNFSGLTLATVNSTRWGGTVGIGFEYLFTPNWSVGLEYDHLFMGNQNNSFGVGGVFANVANRIGQDLDMVTVRFNYKFGGFGGPPVVSRY